MVLPDERRKALGLLRVHGYQNDYLERLQEEKEKAKEAPKEPGAGNKSEGIPVLKDKCISSGQSGSRPGGLYLGKDENGNPKILYDDPKKAGGADKREQSKAISDSPENAEKCTTNTDRVDREIKK